MSEVYCLSDSNANSCLLVKSLVVHIIKVGIYKHFMSSFLGCLDDIIKKGIGRDNSSHEIMR